MDEFAKVLELLAAALERLHIPYVIGGSVASSLRGVLRATLDIDILAAVAPAHAEPLAAALGRDWYAEPVQIRDAVSRGRSFNVIHMPTVHKVDVFPVTQPFHRSQLERATLALLGSVQFPVATAEDILLAKLQWYRDGGEVSDRQWSDITGIVAINPDLDRQYLDTWAACLGVSRLLAKALSDPGREP